MHSLPTEITRDFGKVKGFSARERLRFWANEFIGKPYIKSPLGEGGDSPRLRFDGFDCMTFVETVLALSIADSPEDVQSKLDAIRYKDGIVGFHSRNHFVSADWLPSNSWLLSPLEDIADCAVERVINREKFFAEQGKPLPSGHPLALPTKIIFPYLSREGVNFVEPNSLDCTVVMFVSSLDWLAVGHMGMCFFENGRLELVHASLDEQKVVRIELTRYFEKTKRIGALFARLLV